MITQRHRTQLETIIAASSETGDAGPASFDIDAFFEKIADIRLLLKPKSCHFLKARHVIWHWENLRAPVKDFTAPQIREFREATAIELSGIAAAPPDPESADATVTDTAPAATASTTAADMPETRQSAPESGSAPAVANPSFQARKPDWFDMLLEGMARLVGGFIQWV